jgi:myo-inositol-1(or 4)-monophosphatase
LLGVVIDVFRQEEFVAVHGAGVELDGLVVRVTERTELSECLLATGFPYDRRRHGAEYATTLGAVLTAARGVRRMGTAAIDLAWVAAGRFDGFWEFKLGPWDVGAGMLLVEEAGGILTDHRGDPYRLGGQVVVAGNGFIHEPLRRLVAENLPPHMRPG